MNNQLYIYDCLAQKLRVSNGAFMTIGAGAENTFRVDMEASSAGSFAQRDGICRFFPHGKLESYSLNGKRYTTDSTIDPESMSLFIISSGCFLCWYGAESHRPDFSQFNPKLWYIFDSSTQAWKGPMNIVQLPEYASKMPADTLASFQGLDGAAFQLKDLNEVAEYCRQNNKLADKQESPSDELTSYRCPSCWEEFPPETALAISAHPDLIGDELAGEDAMLRFQPKNFDSKGLPLDSMGTPCVDFACPHCHHKLPPFFQATHQHIFSLVGVPASGKTYFLASMVHQLEHELPRDFGLPFRDANPQGNSDLSNMCMRLFSAQSPQEAYLGKTRLEGSLYQDVWRHGHFASMPHPFIYNLNKGAKAHSIVFYDNAGESYEPGRSGEEHPATDHLSVASAILYLFDPTTNPGFRGLLKDNQDPQLKRQLHPPGRQSLLLAETEMRLRTRLNMPPGEKVDVPFALIIGKCDTWQHPLGPEPLLPAVKNGILLTEHIKANSDRLRQFLFNVSPYICTNAEAISSNVRYFAASALGSSPVEFTDERTGTTLIGPASGKITPIRVIDPILWAFNSIEPDLLPSSKL